MNHSDYRPRRRRSKSRVGRILVWLAGIVVVLVVAIVVATPWILRAGVPEVFARAGLRASVTGGGISLLRREVTLRGFVLGAPDAPALSMGELGVGLNMGALLEGRVKLRHLRVKNVSIDADRLLALKQFSDTGSASPGGLPVELDQLEIEDVQLLSVAERIGHDVRIKRIAINDLSALLGNGKSKVGLQGTVGDGAIDLQLEVGIDKKSMHATGKYHVDRVPLQGWAKLAAAQSDPLTAGVLNGRGDIDAGYDLEAKSLRLTLQGRLSLAGLGAELAALKTEQGDADWLGRLALEWSPDMSTPTIRGEGKLGVAKAHLQLASSSKSAVLAVVDDLSWHGDFDWQNAFTSDGTFTGSQVEVDDAASAAPAWKTRAENFSWRLNVGAKKDSGDLSARLLDFELARLSVTVGAGAEPLQVDAEKLALDEMRTVDMRDLVLGRVSVDTLTITDTAGAKGAPSTTYRIGALAAEGLSGELSGKLHAASVSAESLDVDGSGRSLRAEGIDFASVGFRLPGWVGADELSVKSVRADEGHGDIWLSGLKLRKPHGDATGAFAAESLVAGHMFQPGSRGLSWDATDLSIRDVQGDTDHGAHIAAIALAGIKIGIQDASWESAGLRSDDVALSMDGDVKAASFAFAKLERRQPGAGDLLVNGLHARGFGLHDARALLDRVDTEALVYTSSAGERFQARNVEARRIAANRAQGLEAGAISVAGGGGNFSN